MHASITKSSSLSIVAIVPAAGTGNRMRSSCPKQYLSIQGKTILEYSVMALLYNVDVKRIIVPIRPDDNYFYNLPLAHNPRIEALHGGAHRAESVLAGLRAATDAHWVLVHDASRPCLHQHDLSNLLTLQHTSKIGGILANPVRDTMKRSQNNIRKIQHTVSRECLWHALTPQFFPRKLLMMCILYALNKGAILTDEASALEYCGYCPILVSGRYDNIKITNPEDFSLAKLYLSQHT
ncbi:2-C-methyl-D-erythritol 4-phosphate cytidylyltransferase [Candidatus Profftia lariciata]|uniref:2-C-methyl-D-erythritol 4-phosphate cytidylyltransferase n=1 Tax=Candidatus Profftia lariciata TaxID=1987921 RepID=UPI001D026CC1|nr:2-C-methyl-D-erythritol 4-phosphate cytidylyltransferase [Candidatus Profftia lariciata]UDG81494.1 2-C-methyl-D-erythritol 4-phosphate cytidylyltransferase [Candidatus Profftia lariciata]